MFFEFTTEANLLKTYFCRKNKKYIKSIKHQVFKKEKKKKTITASPQKQIKRQKHKEKNEGELCRRTWEGVMGLAAPHRHDCKDAVAKNGQR